MDKKIGVLILFSVLILIGVIGITKGVVNSANSTDMLGNVSIAIYNDGYDSVNTTKGGVNATVNLTIAYGLGANGQSNITNITVSWSGNYSFEGWIYNDDSGGVFCTDPELGTDCDLGNSTFSNVTITPAGGVGDWSCANRSTTILNCYNTTAGLGPDSHTIMLRFNVTANSNIEDREVWNITVEEDIAVDANSTTVTTYVDGLAPRIVDLNISDGNMTHFNGSFTGANTTDGYYNYLDANSPITIRATFYELSPGINSYLQLYYNGTNSTDMEFASAITSLYSDLSPANATIINPDSCSSDALIAIGAGYTLPMQCSWTIPAKVATTFGNETVTFGFSVNDTFNNAGTWNDTATYGINTIPFSVLTNETLPYIGKINVTDQYGNSRIVLDGTEFLGDDTTITFEVSGAPRVGILNSEGVDMNGSLFIYYNVTGAPTVGINSTITDYDAIINITDGSYNVTLNDNYTNLQEPTYTSLYSVPLYGVDNNSGNTIYFVIVVGGNESQLDNINGNYTMTTRVYSWKIDSEPPGGAGATGITIERVTDSAGITQSDSVGVEYKCSATDTESGVKKYKWTLDRPGADDLTWTDTVGDSSDVTSTYAKRIFKNSDINLLGNYLVNCIVYDIIGNYDASGKTTSASESFTVSAASAVSAAGAEAGGAPTITYDVDFSTAKEGNIKAQEGRIKTFSFDGSTKHTITFDKVTTTSVTLTIASIPTTITVNIGETKNVDLNSDNLNDMGVKLNEIKNGVADVTIKMIEEGAKIVKEQEGAVKGIEGGEQPREVGGAEPVEPKGRAWLWVLLIIVVVAIVGYYLYKRK